MKIWSLLAAAPLSLLLPAPTAHAAAPLNVVATTEDLGSIAREVYGEETVSERHRHRYEVNNAYRDRLEEAGLVFSGTSPDDTLVEYVELPREVHPYYIATQAHPELRSRPTRPHPLFKGLVGAAIARQRELRIPIDESGLRRESFDDE